MPISTTKAESVPFLQGGGEMGKLIRSKDWSQTIIGDFDQWPQSLRTTLSIILNSRFPMFLFWGPELICFYNDAYRPSLGNDGKHPFILGVPGAEAWPEIWSIIKPLIDQVMSGGEASWSEDQLIPIYRNGKIEDVYWTFSYSPVKDESGKAAGVFVTCTETTSKVIGLKRIEESERKFRSLINKALIATAVFKGDDFIIEIANDEALRLWRKDKSVIGKPLADALPELKEQSYLDLMHNVYTTGTTYEGKENIVYLENNGTLEPIYINFIFKALRDEDQNIEAILGMGYDVTEQVNARKRLETLEERTRLAVDANEIGIYDLDILKNEVTISDTMRKIYGIENDFIVEDFISMIHPDDMPARDAAHKIAAETGKLQYQFRIIRKDGTISWIDSHSQIYYNEEGKPVRRIGTVQDITEKIRQVQLLEESERKFKILSGFMPQHIWTSDAKGNLNYFNQSVFEYSGLTPENLETNGWLQIVHPDDRQRNVQEWMHAVETGNPFLFEHRFLRHDGEYRWQLSRALPVRDNDGKIQMWVGTSTDIDEIKKHEQQKDDFIKMASHELKTPVTTIKGYTQLLMNLYSKNNDPLLVSSLSTIDKQITKLTKLITDLLDVTKMETGSFQLQKEEFIIDDLIKDIAGDFQVTTSTHTIILQLQSNVAVHADKDRIGQVLLNLLANAAKYSPKANKIIITSHCSENEVIIGVKDFGIGISPKDQEKIFERFYRVEGKDEKTYPGFGIGLFIVKEIISEHNGKISVESERNTGSTFYFSLPI